MEQRFGFTLMNIDEFAAWLAAQSVTRTVNHLQMHHTWSPSYDTFFGPSYQGDHFASQRAMKRHHVENNGWADIGQHFTIFPDGLICTGRRLSQAPACIVGHNSGGICIENLGDFDAGRDQMRATQGEAIVRASALICQRFSLAINDQGIVYHHWFNSSGGRWTNRAHAVKSCPGTAFFGGNQVVDAERDFFPLVRAAASGTAPELPEMPSRKGLVTASALVVRFGPGTEHDRLGSLPRGEEVRIRRTQGDWHEIVPSGWVSARYVDEFVRRRVVRDRAEVRMAPDSAAPFDDRLVAGNLVRVFEERDGWSRIGTTPRWVETGALGEV